MINKYFYFINRKFYYLMIFWLLIWLGFSLVIINKNNNLLIDDFYSVWIEKNANNISDYNNKIGKQKWLVLFLKTNYIYDKKFLSVLENITYQLESLPSVVNVTSITNVKYSYNGKNDNAIYTKNYYEIKDDLNETSTLIAKLIDMNSDAYTAVFIQNDNFTYNESFYRVEFINNVRAIVLKYSDLVDEYEFYDRKVINTKLNHIIINDMLMFFLFISISLTVLCYFILRSFRDLVVIISIIISGAFPYMGLLVVLNISYNMTITILLMTSVAFSVAGSLYFIVDFHKHRLAGSSSYMSSMKTLSKIFKPTSLIMVITLVGFILLSVGDVLHIVKYILLSVSYVSILWLSMITLMPVLLDRFWRKSKKSSSGIIYFIK